MKQITFLLLAVATVAAAVAFTARASRRTDQEAAPIFVTQIPPGYREWRLISVAHEEGDLNDIRAILGNDKAIKAYREGKLPFPEGTIIARIAWRHVPSEENNKVFGRAQSFVPGDAPPWYLQFMVKDSKRYAATGGWGSLNLIRTANLGLRQISKRVFSATRLSNIATWSSPITHLDESRATDSFISDRRVKNVERNQQRSPLRIHRGR
jgi:Cytochrome P460